MAGIAGAQAVAAATGARRLWVRCGAAEAAGKWRRGKTAGRRAALAPRLELLAARRRAACAGSRARRAFRGRASARAAGQAAKRANMTKLKQAAKLEENAEKWPTGIE